MSALDDEKAFKLLEEAVLKAQTSLEETQHFQPFLMLLSDEGTVEVFENEIKDATQSYASLETIARASVEMGDIDIMLLAVDTQIPEKFVKEVPQGIRLHLEEKSQKEKKIGARFIYVPYELCQSENTGLFVTLHAPIAVGFPAEYIIAD